ncbi:MAG: pyridoxamine 5'-phosphate oxidase family protein [Bacteroidia bacterium]|nr:pyridoxamine 5'-phosphate oxidase family protein [Bacteroidia bacterium]
MNSTQKNSLFLKSDSKSDELWQNMQQELARAVHDKKHPFRLAVLGSQKQEGIGLRYIVLRELSKAGSMLFYTDARSPKVAELQQKPASSLLFYHPQKALQIRVTGKMLIHQKDSLCKEHWKRIQGIVRRAYTPHIQPGTVIENPEAAHVWPEDMTDEYFAILEFIPDSFDLLQLNRLEHLRLEFRKKKEDWEVNWLAP